MRPAGEIREALLNSCRALVTPTQAPTLSELAQHAQVGSDAARRTIANMKRHGVICTARERRVEYRNRPVHEYVPADMVQDTHGFIDLAAVWPAQTA
ncbi:MAG: hypothetical protein DCF26_09490 [Burkholderiales bacterium]|nr:MAG: hypothetical protein DCF26_09490 [Burkholderiales bacterium]